MCCRCCPRLVCPGPFSTLAGRRVCSLSRAEQIASRHSSKLTRRAVTLLQQARDEHQVIARGPFGLPVPVPVPGHADEVIRVLAATFDGLVAFAGSDRTVRLWDPDRPADTALALGRAEAAILTLAVTLDGRVIAGGSDGVLRMWNPREPEEPALELGRHDGSVEVAAVTFDGRVASGGSDGVVQL
jgi:WD40 repeat protein